MKNLHLLILFILVCAPCFSWAEDNGQVKALAIPIKIVSVEANCELRVQALIGSATIVVPAQLAYIDVKDDARTRELARAWLTEKLVKSNAVVMAVYQGDSSGFLPIVNSVIQIEIDWGIPQRDGDFMNINQSMVGQSFAIVSELQLRRPENEHISKMLSALQQQVGGNKQ